MRALLLAASVLLALLAAPPATPQSPGSGCYGPGVHQFVLTAAALTLLVDGFGQDTFDLRGPTTVLVLPVGDTDNDGRQELATEILEFQLTGVSAVFGAIKLSESPTRASVGVIEELSPGTCFPAASHFDVFVQSELPLVTHNDDAVHMSATLTGIPPEAGFSYGGPPLPIPLYLGPSHPPGTLPQETLVGYVSHASHTPRTAEPSPQCADLVDNDGDGEKDFLWDPECRSPLSLSERRTMLCPAAWSHTYGPVVAAGADVRTMHTGPGGLTATVSHVTTSDCDGDGVPGGWDGDYESGVGGGFFGWGPWADEDTCGYALSVHGGNVAVNDFVFGTNLEFVVGENDQGGPAILTDPLDPSLVLGCETDGSITPSLDADDCLTSVYVGAGATCGSGGGDGGYWVFFVLSVEEEDGSVRLANPPTSGILTSF